VISQIAQVGALKQAVESNQISLQATEAGYEVGTKTAIDVLTARQQLVQAQTNYAQAKYAYLNNIIALRLAAGNLDRATIAQINSWLVQPAPLPPESNLGETAPASNAAPGAAAPDTAMPAPAPATPPPAVAPTPDNATPPAPPGTT
jgi:hypothetical protein